MDETIVSILIRVYSSCKQFWPFEFFKNLISSYCKIIVNFFYKYVVIHKLKKNYNVFSIYSTTFYFILFILFFEII